MKSVSNLRHLLVEQELHYRPRRRAMPAGFEGWEPKTGGTNLAFEANPKTGGTNLAFEAKTFLPMFFFWGRPTGTFGL